MNVDAFETYESLTKYRDIQAMLVIFLVFQFSRSVVGGDREGNSSITIFSLTCPSNFVLYVL